jgi:hypothetical protein
MMATIQITLDEETYRRFAARASERGESVEAVVSEFVSRAAAAEAGVALEVASIIERQLQTYEDVFHRLAE